MFYRYDPDNRSRHFFLGPWPGAFGAGMVYLVVLVAIALVRGLPPWSLAVGYTPADYSAVLVASWGQAALWFLLWPVSTLGLWVVMLHLKAGEYGPDRLLQIFGRVWVLTALLMLARDVLLVGLQVAGLQWPFPAWFSPQVGFVVLFSLAAVSAFGRKLVTLWLVLATLALLFLLLLAIALGQAAVIGVG